MSIDLLLFRKSFRESSREQTTKKIKSKIFECLLYFGSNICNRKNFFLSFFIIISLITSFFSIDMRDDHCPVIVVEWIGQRRANDQFFSFSVYSHFLLDSFMFWNQSIRFNFRIYYLIMMIYEIYWPIHSIRFIMSIKFNLIFLLYKHQPIIDSF